MKNLVLNQIPYVLNETNFNFLGEKYEGKVRDNYLKNGIRFLVTTDRQSAFDKVLTTIPFKGQVLNQMAVHWFKKTAHIVDNHIIDYPDPNVVVAKECEMLAVEMVVRACLAGGGWRDYEAGKSLSGIELPKGLKKYQKLPELILTPSTKAEKGKHDLPISEEEILAQGLVEKKLWDECKEKTFALFRLGQEEAAKQGLILVDTKYEFGLVDGKLTLADEIHTMDSSRYWLESSYQERFESGLDPEMLDKEPIRQWLIAQNYMGDGPIPEFTDEHRAEIAMRYIDAFKIITANDFNCEVGSVDERIEKNMRNYIA